MPKVFLSHSSRDKELVARLAEDLTAAGIGVWLDAGEILPGVEPDLDALGRQILGQARDEFLVVAAVGEKGLGHRVLRIADPILGQV